MFTLYYLKEKTSVEKKWIEFLINLKHVLKSMK